MYERMTLSASIPQVTTVAETDATDLLEMSKAKGISVTTFIVRAVVEGLKRFPQINSSLDGRTVVRKGYFNIGVSVATPRGLIVPVLHNAEGKDLAQLAAELKELAAKAREGKLSLEDISGGTFTITNSGVFGSLFFTPRINAPESAILGMGKIMKQPVVRDRSDRHPVDDLPLAHLRPPPHRRRDGGHLPAGGEKGPAGPRKTLIGDTADQPGAELRFFNGCNPVQSGGRIYGKCGSFEA